MDYNPFITKLSKYLTKAYQAGCKSKDTTITASEIPVGTVGKLKHTADSQKTGSDIKKPFKQKAN